MVTTRLVRKGKFAKTMLRVASEVDQRSVDSKDVRARMEVQSVKRPIMNSRARRSRRGVGMKGTGRSMIRRVVGIERARWSVERVLKDGHRSWNVSACDHASGLLFGPTL